MDRRLPGHRCLADLRHRLDPQRRGAGWGLNGRGRRHHRRGRRWWGCGHSQIVAQRTGLSQQDAEKRVSDVYAKAQAKVRDAEVAARDATDKARKTSAYSALWLFVSPLIGAFVASLAATLGGRRRDA